MGHVPASSETPDSDALTVHASCVALDGRALLIRGASGTGKSALALDLIARGATLIADDRTRLWREGAQVMAQAPEALSGQIEARGMGILRAPHGGPAPLALIVDMDETESARLPEPRGADILGISLPEVRKVEGAHFTPALLIYLVYGRIA